MTTIPDRARMKCPYTFPDRTRMNMIGYLGKHSGYVPMNTWNGGFVLSWNVKVYSFDEMGKSAPADYPVHERFDRQWRDYINDNPEFFGMLCEDASSFLTARQWTNWPGIEQGEWNFDFNGRSGGHLILTDAPAWCPAPKAWKMYPMVWNTRGEYRDWLENLDTPTLQRFYRAIRVMDTDFTQDKAAREVSYQAAFQRHQWEEELLAREDCDARRQEHERPDMYGTLVA